MNNYCSKNQLAKILLIAMVFLAGNANVCVAIDNDPPGVVSQIVEKYIPGGKYLTGVSPYVKAAATAVEVVDKTIKVTDTSHIMKAQFVKNSQVVGSSVQEVPVGSTISLDFVVDYRYSPLDQLVSLQSRFEGVFIEIFITMDDKVIFQKILPDARPWSIDDLMRDRTDPKYLPPKATELATRLSLLSPTKAYSGRVTGKVQIGAKEYKNLSNQPNKEVAPTHSFKLYAVMFYKNLEMYKQIRMKFINRLKEIENEIDKIDPGLSKERRLEEKKRLLAKLKHDANSDEITLQNMLDELPQQVLDQSRFYNGFHFPDGVELAGTFEGMFTKPQKLQDELYSMQRNSGKGIKKFLDSVPEEVLEKIPGAKKTLQYPTASGLARLQLECLRIMKAKKIGTILRQSGILQKLYAPPHEIIVKVTNPFFLKINQSDIEKTKQEGETFTHDLNAWVNTKRVNDGQITTLLPNDPTANISWRGFDPNNDRWLWNWKYAADSEPSWEWQLGDVITGAEQTRSKQFKLRMDETTSQRIVIKGGLTENDNPNTYSITRFPTELDFEASGTNRIEIAIPTQSGQLATITEEFEWRTPFRIGENSMQLTPQKLTVNAGDPVRMETPIILRKSIVDLKNNGSVTNIYRGKWVDGKDIRVLQKQVSDLPLDGKAVIELQFDEPVTKVRCRLSTNIDRANAIRMTSKNGDKTDKSWIGEFDVAQIRLAFPGAISVPLVVHAQSESGVVIDGSPSMPVVPKHKSYDRVVDESFLVATFEKIKELLPEIVKSKISALINRFDSLPEFAKSYVRSTLDKYVNAYLFMGWNNYSRTADMSHVLQFKQTCIPPVKLPKPYTLPNNYSFSGRAGNYRTYVALPASSQMTLTTDGFKKHDHARVTFNDLHGNNLTGYGRYTENFRGTYVTSGSRKKNRTLEFVYQQAKADFAFNVNYLNLTDAHFGFDIGKEDVVELPIGKKLNCHLNMNSHAADADTNDRFQISYLRKGQTVRVLLDKIVAYDDGWYHQRDCDWNKMAPPHANAGYVGMVLYYVDCTDNKITTAQVADTHANSNQPAEINFEVKNSGTYWLDFNGGYRDDMRYSIEANITEGNN